MTDQCQYLEYRSLTGPGDSGGGDGSDGAEGSGDSDGVEPRAYCTAADEFVQAMRADICNRRYGLDPESDCEFYRDAEGLSVAPPDEGAAAGADTQGGEAGDAGGATDAGGD